MQTPPLNLLLITFDQLRGDWCDPLAPIVDTPNINALASQGWTARRCYAASPQCVPVRLNWMTGLYPSQLGVTFHRNVDLPPDAPSIVRELRDAGWHTELVGKSHVFAHVPGRDLRDERPRLSSLGFDEVLEIAGPRGLRGVECALTDAWRDAGVLDDFRRDMETRYGAGRGSSAWEVRPTVLPVELYPDIWLAERALARIDALPTDRPWFLWLSFVGPHEPFDTPPPWAGRHATSSLPPATPTPDWIAMLPDRASIRKRREGWSGHIVNGDIDACRRDYADHIQLLDEQTGRVADAVLSRSDAGRTAIAVTADHGELVGDGGMLYKGVFLEGAVRVPWVYRPAPCEALDTPLHTSAPLCSTMSLRTTIRSLADGNAGQAMLDRAASHPGVISEFSEETMVVEGTRKVVVDRKGRPLWAIDLAADPAEQRNVVTAPDWPTDAWRGTVERARRHAASRRGRRWRVLRLPEVST